MGRPQKHFWKTGDSTCWGLVQGVYVRKGAGSGRWIKLGDMCLDCHAFWAVDPDATAQQIVDRSMALSRPGAPS